jgi:hypothetical protein
LLYGTDCEKIARVSCFKVMLWSFFDFERTWWRLFQNSVLHIKFDICIFIKTHWKNCSCKKNKWNIVDLEI